MSKRITELVAATALERFDSLAIARSGDNYKVPIFLLGDGATFTIAADDANARIKAKADYICDGIADDVQVKAAIDALTVGGRIWLSEGTFNFDAPVTLATGTSIVGAGIAKTIVNGNFSGAGTFGVFDTSGLADTDDIAIAELTIDLTDAPTNTRGILFRRGTGLQVTRVKVVDTSSAAGAITTVGIQLGTFNSGSILVNDVVISACISDGKSDGGRDFVPLALYWCQNVHVSDTHCKGRDSGVAIDAAKSPCVSIQGVDNLTISNSIAELGHHNGIFFSDSTGAGFQSTDVTIVGCLIDGNGDDGIDSNNTVGLTISACTFDDNEFFDVSCEDSCDKVAVTGNSFVNGRVNFKDSTNLVFTGNMLYGSSDSINLITADGVDGLVIASNMLGNGSTAVDITDSVRVLVSANLVRMAKFNGSFVTLTDSSFCTIKGNQVSCRDGFDGALFKLNVFTEVGASDNNRYEDNDDRQVSGASTFTIIGASTIARRNEYYVTENGGTSAAIATGGTIAHGLDATPTIVQVNAAEAGPTDITIEVGAADITVNFGGGGNKTFFWSARVDP